MLGSEDRTPADEVSSAGVFCVLRAHMGPDIDWET